MIPKLFGWPSSCRAVHGSVGHCSTVRCVSYRCYCCVGGVTPGLAAAAGGQVAFRAPGVSPKRSVVAVGPPVASFPGVSV